MAAVNSKALLIDGTTLYGASESSKNAGSEKEPARASFALLPDDESMSLSNALKEVSSSLSISDGVPLALPPDILVTKVLSLPAVDPESIADMTRLAMEKFAPVSDDDLEVAYEVITATENSTRIFAVATPISTLDKIAGHLGQSGTVITRLDSSLLCEWTSFKHYLQSGTDNNLPADNNSLNTVIFVPESGRYDLVIYDNFGPLFARTLGVPNHPEELSCELTLSILDFSTDYPDFTFGSLCVVSHAPLRPDFLLAIRNSTGVDINEISESNLGKSYIASLLEREELNDCIDIVPPIWRTEEQAAIAQKRFYCGIAIAFVVWIIFALAIFLLPKIPEKKTASLNKDIEAIQSSYNAVADTRRRVRLIREYEKRDLSFLDTFKTVCTIMPDGMIFSSVSYDKGGDAVQNGTPAAGGFRFTGDAPSPNSVLDFKDSLDSCGLFRVAELRDQKQDAKRGRSRFEIDSRFLDSDGGMPQ